MKMLRIIMNYWAHYCLPTVRAILNRKPALFLPIPDKCRFCLGCSKTMRPWCRHAEANRSRSLVCGMLLPMNVERLLSPYIRSWKKTSQN